MSNELVLNLGAMSDYFFDKAELWGVSSSMTGYDFCHVMNVCLRLNLIRRVDFDLAYYFKPKPKDSGMMSLFGTPVTEKVYFPVYHQQMELSDSEIFVYSNRQNGNVLIRHLKNIDFFVLVKNAIYMEHLRSLDKYIANFQKIGMCTKFDLEKETWIGDLIL